MTNGGASSSTGLMLALLKDTGRIVGADDPATNTTAQQNTQRLRAEYRHRVQRLAQLGGGTPVDQPFTWHDPLFFHVVYEEIHDLSYKLRVITEEFPAAVVTDLFEKIESLEANAITLQAQTVSRTLQNFGSTLQAQDRAPFVTAVQRLTVLSGVNGSQVQADQPVLDGLLGQLSTAAARNNAMPFIEQQIKALWGLAGEHQERMRENPGFFVAPAGPSLGAA